MLPRLAAGLLAIAFVMPGAGVAAQPTQGKAATVDGPAWSTLSSAQQAALAPLKRDWPGLDDLRKQKWLEIAARFPSMPGDEQQRVQDRMSQWARMSPEERGRARLQFQETRQVSPQQRQSRWDAYMALPEAERRALAKSASTIPKAASADLAPGKGTSGATLGRPAAKLTGAKAGALKDEPKAIAPVTVQARPGVSTTLISDTAKPPPHVRAGAPKIAADQGVVNRSTLLPQAGPQSAAALRPPSPASATR